MAPLMLVKPSNVLMRFDGRALSDTNSEPSDADAVVGDASFSARALRRYCSASARLKKLLCFGFVQPVICFWAEGQSVYMPGRWPLATA
jgi:hypothetical protein